MTHRVLSIVFAGILIACSETQAPRPQAPETPGPSAESEPLETGGAELAAPDPSAEAAPSASSATDPVAIQTRAAAIFGVLPDEGPSASNPLTEEKITLGRMLYYDPRLSKNQDVSCNSCHALDRFGVDGEATSPGHRGQRGDRNSPTVYNAALHVAQFWDGRAADVEEQAKGPVLNPVEMAMPNEESVLVVLNSIPGYPPLFAAAFPEDENPVTFDNMAGAIGAFERRLMTPSRFDAYLEGENTALSDEEVAGLEVFFETGCIQCHVGPTLGGISFQKLGRNEPYPTEDTGRFRVTGVETDRFFFKVPSLRNVAETGPWFHHGAVETLPEAVHLMGRHQLGQDLSGDQVDSIVLFLGSLTGEVDQEYIAQPELPASGPETPAPDPS